MVGSGESGSDICNEISKYASSTGLAIRGKHGHLIPRKQADGRVTDLNTNRCRYSNPYVLGDWVGYVNQLVSSISFGHALALWGQHVLEKQFLFYRFSIFGANMCLKNNFVLSCFLFGRLWRGVKKAASELCVRPLR